MAVEERHADVEVCDHGWGWGVSFLGRIGVEDGFPACTARCGGTEIEQERPGRLGGSGRWGVRGWEDDVIGVVVSRVRKRKFYSIQQAIQTEL